MKSTKSTIKNILDDINGSFNIAEESEFTVIQIETFEREKKEGGWEGGREREKSNRSRWGGG